MKIIILGAGQVGRTLAEHLLTERNDITLVDTNADVLKQMGDKFDLRTIRGSASYPEVLENAGGQDADMLIAVTATDEVNILACQIAHFLFKTPVKIARIRAPEYTHYPQLFNNKAIAIDVLTSPEHLMIRYIMRLIEYPGALQVLDFADSRIELVVVKAQSGAPLVGLPMSQLTVHMPSVEARIVALSRAGKTITPTIDTIIEADDEVSFIAAAENVREVNSELRGIAEPYQHIMIAGGGNIGLSLALALENHYSVKIINRSEERCQVIAEKLNNAIVLQGDAIDENLLRNENIHDVDVFCALTNDDEINILSATLAKRMGARKVMALINRQAYVDLIVSQEIDIIISPQQATISNLLSFVRRGDIVQVHSLRRGTAEALEIVAHGTQENSQVIGRTISELPLPPTTLVGAIVRAGIVKIATPELVIESEDHVILFTTDKKDIYKIERLFQVGLSFF